LIDVQRYVDTIRVQIRTGGIMKAPDLATGQDGGVADVMGSGIQIF
jgi:hypothetical protein